MRDTSDPHPRNGRTAATPGKLPTNRDTSDSPPASEHALIPDLPPVSELPDYIAWAKVHRTTAYEPGL